MSEGEQAPDSIVRLLQALKGFDSDESPKRGFNFKAGPSDVILSTPSKSGTTVTQQVKIIYLDYVEFKIRSLV